MSLILNLTTGLVSPKFHINRNEIFETVRPAATNETTTSLWKRLSGFTRGKMKIPEGGQSNVIDEFQQLHTTTEINPINPNIPAENDLSRNLRKLLIWDHLKSIHRDLKRKCRFLDTSLFTAQF